MECVERPCIFIQNCAVAWSVLIFWHRITLWCGASSHVHLELRSRVERPRNAPGLGQKKSARPPWQSNQRTWPEATQKRALVRHFHANRAVVWGVLGSFRRIARRRGGSLYFRSQLRSHMECPRIFAQNRALVSIFLCGIALQRGASLYFHSQLSSRVERPRIFAQNGALVTLVCSVLAFSFRIALSGGASSYFGTELRSGVERPHMFT